MNNHFEKNLEALAQVDMLAASRILEVKENIKFSVYSDEDPINVNIIDIHTKQTMYTGKPVDETLNKIKQFKKYTLYPYLYFYGLGNGIFYKLLLANRSLKRVVVVEPEPEIMFIGLHFADLSQEIKDGRFVLVYSEDLDFVKANDLINQGSVKIFVKLYDMHLLSPFYNRYHEDFLKINKIFIRSIEHTILSVGNDATDALTGIRHHIQNIPYMLKSPTVYNFIQKANNTDTAVITSTGPSLHKQLPLLKEIQDYVTIICIDASFPILSSFGIKPDIVVTLERIELTSKFYKDTPKECYDGVIFALTSIVHEKLRESIKGGLKQFSARPFGYTKFFELEKWGYLGIGMSAANMAYEIAAFSKFKNCILIGQDLAYGEDGNTHSKGYTLKKDDFKPSNTEIYIEKYGGNGEVRTNNIWLSFLNFFENDISKTKHLMGVYNCTEGGARIQAAIEEPFASVVNRVVDRSSAKKAIKLENISQEEHDRYYQQSKDKIEEILTYGEKVKKEIEEVFLKVAKKLEDIEKLNKENRLEEIDFDEITKLIEEIDDIKSYFEDKQFLLMFYDSIQSYIIHQELEIAKIQVKYSEDEEYKKTKLIDWLYAHRYWLFSLAGGISALLDVTKISAHSWAKDVLDKLGYKEEDYLIEELKEN